MVQEAEGIVKARGGETEVNGVSFVGIMLLVVLSITILSFLFGALLLPIDNPSHEMNPFSWLRLWFLGDEERIFNSIKFCVFIVVIFTLITPFMNHYFFNKKKLILMTEQLYYKRCG
ncbi:MAG TPA: hypothetical protein ENI23_15435 [bacterium]|nr:hypothetical protein [bacterium]